MKNKVTIITPVFNAAKTIKSNLASIKRQSYYNWEHIIIDNKSTDNSLKIIKKNSNKKIKIISERDNGIYDAINKGIKIAKGDIISILHADDLYFSKHVLSCIVNKIKKHNVDIVFGNLVYVKKNNLQKILRYWKSGNHKLGSFNKGWSPPHPSFFMKKKIYKKFGLYKTFDAADIELMHRMLEKHKVSNYYVNKVLIKMRYGGTSNKNLSQIARQNIQSLKFLKLDTLSKILRFIYYKVINRLAQLMNRKRVYDK